MVRASARRTNAVPHRAVYRTACSSAVTAEAAAARSGGAIVKCTQQKSAKLVLEIETSSEKKRNTDFTGTNVILRGWRSMCNFTWGGEGKDWKGEKVGHDIRRFELGQVLHFQVQFRAKKYVTLCSTTVTTSLVENNVRKNEKKYFMQLKLYFHVKVGYSLIKISSERVRAFEASEPLRQLCHKQPVPGCIFPAKILRACHICTGRIEQDSSFALSFR